MNEVTITGETFNKAYVKAESIHLGKTRRSGEAQFSHSLAVAMKFKGDEEKMSVSILHDCPEDSPCPEDCLEYIKNEFPQSISFSVEKLTHEEGMSYCEYIRDVSTDRNASLVKIADLEDNLSDCKPKHRSRYLAALYYLNCKLFGKKNLNIPV